jgi:hypothetical protein
VALYVEDALRSLKNGDLGEQLAMHAPQFITIEYYIESVYVDLIPLTAFYRLEVALLTTRLGIRRCAVCNHE